VRWQNTLILVGALILLGAFVYFADIRTQSPPPEQPPFMEFAVPDVMRFQVETREGQRMVAIRKSPGIGWEMKEPYQAEADQARLEGILARLSSIKPSRVLTETTASLASFGLDPPQLTVEVKLRDGSAQSLEIGDGTPNQAARYVRRTGEQAVLLMESATANQLNLLITAPPERPTPVMTPTPVDTPIPTAGS